MFGWQPHLIEIYKSMHGNMAITVFFSLKIGFYAIKASTLLIGTFFTNNTNITFRGITGLRCHCPYIYPYNVFFAEILYFLRRNALNWY